MLVLGVSLESKKRMALGSKDVQYLKGVGTRREVPFIATFSTCT